MVFDEIKKDTINKVIPYMDNSTIKLNKIEAKLKNVLADIAGSKEEPIRVLQHINPTAEQYSEAWETLSTLDIVETHIETLYNNVKSGDEKKVSLFIDFIIYELDRFGEKDKTQTVIYNAQQMVKDIYTKFRNTYFIA